MRHPQKHPLIRILAGSVALAILAVVACIVLFFACFGIIEPQTSVGSATFQVLYSFPPTRPVVLRFYHWSLNEFNAGYVPTEIDDFLADRLQRAPRSREGKGILDFHLAQKLWRWGDAITTTNDATKGEMIRELMRRSQSASPAEQMEIYLLVESLRRGQSFHKAQFYKPYATTGDIYTPVRAHFQAWWADGSAWPANKATDPLQGTGISVFAP